MPPTTVINTAITRLRCRYRPEAEAAARSAACTTPVRRSGRRPWSMSQPTRRRRCSSWQGAHLIEQQAFSHQPQAILQRERPRLDAAQKAALQPCWRVGPRRGTATSRCRCPGREGKGGLWVVESACGPCLPRLRRLPSRPAAPAECEAQRAPRRRSPRRVAGRPPVERVAGPTAHAACLRCKRAPGRDVEVAHRPPGAAAGGSPQVVAVRAGSEEWVHFCRGGGEAAAQRRAGGAARLLRAGQRGAAPRGRANMQPLSRVQSVSATHTQTRAGSLSSPPPAPPPAEGGVQASSKL